MGGGVATRVICKCRPEFPDARPAMRDGHRRHREAQVVRTWLDTSARRGPERDECRRSRPRRRTTARTRALARVSRESGWRWRSASCAEVRSQVYARRPRRGEPTRSRCARRRRSSAPSSARRFAAASACVCRSRFGRPFRARALLSWMRGGVTSCSSIGITETRVDLRRLMPAAEHLPDENVGAASSMSVAIVAKEMASRCRPVAAMYPRTRSVTQSRSQRIRRADRGSSPIAVRARPRDVDGRWSRRERPSC